MGRHHFTREEHGPGSRTSKSNALPESATGKLIIDAQDDEVAQLPISSHDLFANFVPEAGVDSLSTAAPSKAPPEPANVE
eukprot:1173023-Prorocentrum_minimum.AAC.1